MPPEVKTAMDYRREFVLQAIQEGANVRELCRRYQYAPATGYKWIARYQAEGLAGLADRSRRPHTSPHQTDPALAERLVALRDQHPSWGGRKLHAWCRQHDLAEPPAASTITGILRRAGRLSAEPVRPQAYHRFVTPAPNDLWQLDFMGHRPLAQGRVHPLSLLDDHSRFGLALVAGGDQRRATVEQALGACFARYGLPWALLCDNGPPWGSSGQSGLSWFDAWLLRLGIRVLHGRPYHPQTQGKVERWHQTIGREVFGPRPFADRAQAQVAFDHFRSWYNTERPHDALEGAVPASRYRMSARALPATLPPLGYDAGDRVCRVHHNGEIAVDRHRVYVGSGLAGLAVALRPTLVAGVLAVRFAQQEIATIDLRRSDGNEA